MDTLKKVVIGPLKFDTMFQPAAGFEIDKPGPLLTYDGALFVMWENVKMDKNTLKKFRYVHVCSY